MTTPASARDGRLPLPPHFAPEQARAWGYQPEPQELLESAADWRREHAVAPAGEDPLTVRLLLVDLQRDFCLPEGSLYVGGRSGTGAIDDNLRIARFVYENLAWIGEIVCTLDTHLPFQIFFPSFWVDREGNPPKPNREVSTDDLRSGRLRPNPGLAAWLCAGDQAWLERQVAFYCSELERAGKYTLYLWPPHCLLGGDGHALAGVVQAARLFHAFARQARNDIEIKGAHALSEHYSVLSPEVLGTHDGEPLFQRNSALLERLLASDALLVAGQAASHCVKSTLEDLLREIRRRDASLARRVYVLRDCMSAVAVPDPEHPGELLFDFTPQAEACLETLAEAGMHVVESTAPIRDWLEVAR
jgi:nicotinamidase-related amidase